MGLICRGTRITLVQFLAKEELVLICVILTIF